MLLHYAAEDARWAGNDPRDGADRTPSHGPGVDRIQLHRANMAVFPNAHPPLQRDFLVGVPVIVVRLALSPVSGGLDEVGIKAACLDQVVADGGRGGMKGARGTGFRGQGGRGPRAVLVVAPHAGTRSETVHGAVVATGPPSWDAVDPVRAGTGWGARIPSHLCQKSRISGVFLQRLVSRSGSVL